MNASEKEEVNEEEENRNKRTRMNNLKMDILTEAN